MNEDPEDDPIDAAGVAPELGSSTAAPPIAPRAAPVVRAGVAPPRDSTPGQPAGATDLYVPTAEEVWERIGRVLRTEFPRLRREVRDDLLSAFFVLWCEAWYELLLEQEVRHWKAWLSNRVRWRVKDYLRSPGHRADSYLGEGGKNEGPEDQPGLARHSSLAGAIRLDEDPIEESEWRRLHAHVWEQLPERHRVVLLVYAENHRGDIADRSDAARVATGRLGLKSPLTENAYSIRVTRAARHFIEALSKVDESWDHEFERILVSEQGKRVVWACSHRKVDSEWWLGSDEQAVFSVAVEVTLGWRARSDALREASARLPGAIGQTEFDTILQGALDKLEGVGQGPFLNTRLMMEYVAENWDRVVRPTEEA